jgi:hypothetical protein
MLKCGKPTSFSLLYFFFSTSFSFLSSSVTKKMNKINFKSKLEFKKNKETELEEKKKMN